MNKFLFQIGAIKSHPPHIAQHPNHQFLFQIGAIKSLTGRYPKDNKSMFLFQIGAIKRVSGSPRYSYWLSFYSKLVRLKEYY